MARREQRRQSRRPYFYGPADGRIEKIRLAFGTTETGLKTDDQGNGRKSRSLAILSED